MDVQIQEEVKDTQSDLCYKVQAQSLLQGVRD